MPNSLMVDPCGVTSAGDTVRSLSIGYVKNTGCVFDYKLLLEKQRQWTEKQRGLYDTVK
jgi:hypothetical protein